MSGGGLKRKACKHASVAMAAGLNSICFAQQGPQKPCPKLVLSGSPPTQKVDGPLPRPLRCRLLPTESLAWQA